MIVPVIVIGALVLVWVVASAADSFVRLAGSLPALTANPPPFLTDLQTWLAARGIDVDVVATFHSIVTDALSGMVDLMIGLFGGAFAAVGTFVDGLLVVSLAVFMVIDSEKILRFGLGVIPPDKREDAMKFRHGIGAAVAGFIRSQLWLGGVYGIWAIGVGLAFGLPYVLATAVLTALIMAIPIYGPYVSWLPPVLVAALVRAGIRGPRRDRHARRLVHRHEHPCAALPCRRPPAPPDRRRLRIPPWRPTRRSSSVRRSRSRSPR